MFEQPDNIQDHVLPLVKGKRLENGYFGYSELIGTVFLIGPNGFALTAAHIIEQCFDDPEELDVVFVLFWNSVGGGWVPVEVIGNEKHESEDVGIIRLKGNGYSSIFSISSASQIASCEYCCWGYPHEVAKEVQLLKEGVIERPDLIFTQGYVRRRISRELYPTIIFRGKQFYELSEIVGQGNSGAPVILKESIWKNKLQFFGIYIGEKSGGNVSYAVRTEAFSNWRPRLLGRMISQEAL